MFEAKIREERGRGRGHEIEEKAAGAEEMVVVIAGVIGVQAATEEIAETEERRTSGPAESRPVVAEAARAVRGLMKIVVAEDRVVKEWAAAEVRGAMMEAKEAVVTGSDRGVKKGATVVVAGTSSGVLKCVTGTASGEMKSANMGVVQVEGAIEIMAVAEARIGISQEVVAQARESRERLSE